MKKDIQSLANSHDLTVKSIGQSEFGRDILAVKVGKGSNSILITGSHHGREWLSTHVLMKMIEEYAKAYQSKQKIFGHGRDILNDVSIWFIPMVNPDGVMLQQKGVDSMPFLFQEVYVDMNEGSDDFTRWKANGLGVDLNRQYPAGWEHIKEDKKFASYSHFKGNQPLESSETRALSTFTNQLKPLAAAAYHTSGRVIYWYFHNEVQYLARDIQFVDSIVQKTGYKVDYPPLSATGGGYTDWFIQTYKRPAVTIELSYPVEETNPPLSVLSEEWERNKEIGMVIADYARKHIDKVDNPNSKEQNKKENEQ
ncbi:M14 family metallopeptidase [Metabacillus malikii]|nr:M14 family metallocarboxypeptidase [Metabacillus malikii]